MEKDKREIAKKRKIFSQARAIIQRGRSAGIPDKYLRIKKEDFAQIISENNIVNKDAVNIVYLKPQKLFEKPFIVIDGGDIYSRKKAGFAILFRMIACDRHGAYFNCKDLSTKFQTISSSQTHRNDLVENIKKKDILFISEFSHRDFSVHFDSGLFFDQLLEHRDDYTKPTIITFSNPLESKEFNKGNAIKDDRCGKYLSMISHADIKSNANIFRVTVK